MRKITGLPPYLPNRQTRRKVWLQVHLYLGLLAGAVLSVVGLTGSVLVFYEELQELINRRQIVVTVPQQQEQPVHTLDEIVAAAEAVKPDGSQFFKVYYPRAPEFAYKLLYFCPLPGHPESTEGDGYYIFVNPYTAQATGRQLWHPARSHWDRPLISLIMQLHYCLLLDTPGVIFIGIIGTLMVISVLTGLLVWWPLTGKFKQALLFKRNASTVRFVFDLHKIAGIYLAPVLLAVLFSGIYFNLPEQVNGLVKQFSDLQRPNAWEGIDSARIQSAYQPGLKPIGLAAVEQAVNRHYPTGRFWMLEKPSHEHGVYRVAKRDAQEISAIALDYRDFAVDQYTGDILKAYTANSGSAGDIFLDWQWPLHSGQAFGWTGRGLVFLSGLACPLLFATGLTRWQQKQRGKHHKAT